MAATVTDLGNSVATTASVAHTISGGSPQVGDLVLVLVANDSSTAISAGQVTDSGGNTYTQPAAAKEFGWTSPSTHRAAWFESVLTVALTNGVSTVTFNPASNTVSKVVWVIWIQGLTASPFDKNANSVAQASTTSPVTGTTAAVTGGDELSLAFFSFPPAGETFTAPAGYSTTGLVQAATAGNQLELAFKEATLSGTQSATGTLSPAATAGGGISIWLVAASGAPTVSIAKGRRRRRIGLTRRRTLPLGGLFQALLVSPLCPGTNNFNAVRRRHTTLKKRKRQRNAVAFAVRNTVVAVPAVPPENRRRRPRLLGHRHPRTHAIPFGVPNIIQPFTPTTDIRRRPRHILHHRPRVPGSSFAVRNTAAVTVPAGSTADHRKHRARLPRRRARGQLAFAVFHTVTVGVTPERTKMGVGL